MSTLWKYFKKLLKVCLFIVVLYFAAGLIVGLVIASIASYHGNNDFFSLTFLGQFMLSWPLMLLAIYAMARGGR